MPNNHKQNKTIAQAKHVVVEGVEGRGGGRTGGGTEQKETQHSQTLESQPVERNTTSTDVYTATTLDVALFPFGAASAGIRRHVPATFWWNHIPHSTLHTSHSILHIPLFRIVP